MKNMLIGFTITAAFVTAVYFGANGEFWNAAGWSLLTFAIIMLVIQHENHKAELAKKEQDLLAAHIYSDNLLGDAWYSSEILALKLSQIAYTEDILKAMKQAVEALPTAEELEDPELREFYSLVIEEIKHQNL